MLYRQRRRGTSSLLVYREKGKLKSTDIFAINEGVVYKVGKDNVSGNYIYIEYPTLGILLFYCHLKKIYLKKNAKVIKGTKVGLTGTTGNSTGIHLHLGVKLINSNVWLNPSYISLTSYNYSYMASEYLKSYSKRSEYAVNFRREAGLNGSVIEIINKGSLVVVLKENAYVVDGYKWDKVKYNNKEGYVANKYFNDICQITDDFRQNTPDKGNPNVDILLDNIQTAIIKKSLLIEFGVNV